MSDRGWREEGKEGSRCRAENKTPSGAGVSKVPLGNGDPGNLRKEEKKGKGRCWRASLAVEAGPSMEGTRGRTKNRHQPKHMKHKKNKWRKVKLEITLCNL